MGAHHIDGGPIRRRGVVSSALRQAASANNAGRLSLRRKLLLELADPSLKVSSDLELGLFESVGQYRTVRRHLRP